MPKRKSFLLRIDPGLWEEIERWAADELRSANAQVEFLLRQAFNQRRKKMKPPPEDAADGGDKRDDPG